MREDVASPHIHQDVRVLERNFAGDWHALRVRLGPEYRKEYNAPCMTPREIARPWRDAMTVRENETRKTGNSRDVVEEQELRAGSRFARWCR